MQYLETMKAILPIFLVFLSTTLLAQNIPSIEQVEAELEELKKKDDLRAYTLELARQRDSLIEVFDRQVLNLEQELSSTEASLSQIEFDFDNAMTSIEALNQNKEMLENKNSQQAIEISELHAQIIELHTTISDLKSTLVFSDRDTLLPVTLHPNLQSTLDMLGVSDKIGSKCFPKREWDEEPTQRNEFPLFFTFAQELKKGVPLLLNINEQLEVLRLSFVPNYESDEGVYYEEYNNLFEEYEYTNSTFKAILALEQMSGGAGECCRHVGCLNCNSLKWDGGFIKLYRDGKLFLKEDFVRCGFEPYHYCD